MERAPAKQVLLGPNKVIGEIYSSGWNHYMESFDNMVKLDPLAEPDILAGILTYRGTTYTIPYNEIIVEGDRFESRMLYIPRTGRTTTLILWGKLANFAIKGNTATLISTARDADDDVTYEFSITLYLSAAAAAAKILTGK